MSYTGDLSAQDSWDVLNADETSILIDVRTTAEWNLVGIPDLSTLSKEPLFLEWQSYPTMAINQDFIAQVKAKADEGQTILCLCRSGARSAAAATALTAAGFSTVYNIAEGFEGNPNALGQRGQTGGWKAANLPWRQG
ncbi:MAG: rhodanese-like domain-containing protein [Sphingomonadales bacterium]